MYMTQIDLQFPHKLVLNERKALRISGVTGVVGFDEETVLLHTTLGDLTVQGQSLTLENLSLEGGEVAVNGTIRALIYSDAPTRGGWRRLFR